jgi:GDPmannose 4,6-dehydratase
MKKALITGITGQSGSFLTEYLLEKGYEVHGIVRRSSTFNTSRIDHLYNNPEIMGKTLFTHYGDLTDTNSINTIVDKIQADELYHLGAMSHVKTSFEIPHYTFQANTVGTLNVIEAVKNHSPHTKILNACTSEMFGGVPSEMPRDGYNESSKFHPMSPYGVSKLSSYWMAENYKEAYDLFISQALTFNHESGRRGPTFVTRKITLWFAQFMKAIENNTEIKPIFLGNLDAFRDWSHAKDIIGAQHTILQLDFPDNFVLSSGESHSVREFIEACFHLKGKFIEWSGNGIDEIGLCDGKEVIKVDPKYFRPTEVHVLLGDSSKAKNILGWKPTYSFMDLVEDMVNSDLKTLGL